ncbi:unnamed protein product, partial [Mesorhabditis spiculigera]
MGATDITYAPKKVEAKLEQTKRVGPTNYWVRPISLKELEEPSGSEEPDAPGEFYFLDPGSFESTNDILHREVFLKCQEAGLDPRWMKMDIVEKSERGDPNFYVLPRFEGPAYEILKERRCKTVSSFLVRECLRLDRCLVKIDIPVYSLHLDGVKVTFTGFATAEKKRLTELVYAMGGHSSPRFSHEITHLVAARYDPTNPDKYQSGWLEDAWTRATNHEPGNFSAEQFYEPYRMPLFKGLVITKTGVAQEQLADLIRAIEMNGGKYSAALNKNCTHMITELCNGDKFRRVKEWQRDGVKQVFIVTMKWLFKCIEMKYVVPESRYDPERPACSTQKGQEATMQDPELSAIYGQQNGKLPTQSDSPFWGNTSVGARNRRSGANSSSATNNHPTTPSTTKNQSNLEASLRERDRVATLRREESRARMSGGEFGSRIGLPRSNSILAEPAAIFSRKARELVDPVDQLKDEGERLEEDLDVLEGTRVLIVGASAASIPTWKKLLNSLGACRVTKMRSDAIVIVVRINGADDERTIKEAEEAGAEVVTSKWAIECFEKRDNLPTHDFLWSDRVVELEKEVAAEMEAPRKGRSDVEFIGIYTGTTAELTSGMQFPGPPSSRSMGPISDEQSTTNCFATTSNFYGSRKVRIFERGMDDGQIADMKEEIVECGGKYLPPEFDVPADYLLCPLIDLGGLPTPKEANAEHIVSTYWQRCCVIEGKLLEPDSCPLFRPIPACGGSTVFENCVVSVTGLDHPLREQIKEFVENFGGIFQATICKNSRNGEFRNTHVIAGSDNEKAKMAVKWGIKVVDPAWLLESIINDKLISEAAYPVGDSPFCGSYTRSDDIWEACKQGMYDVVVQIRDVDESFPTYMLDQGSINDDDDDQGKEEASILEPIASPSPSIQYVKTGDKLAEASKPKPAEKETTTIEEPAVTPTTKHVSAVKNGKTGRQAAAQSIVDSSVMDLLGGMGSPEAMPDLAQRIMDKISSRDASSTQSLPKQEAVVSSDPSTSQNQSTRATKRRRVAEVRQEQSETVVIKEEPLEINTSKRARTDQEHGDAFPNLLIDWSTQRPADDDNAQEAAENLKIRCFDESIQPTPGATSTLRASATRVSERPVDEVGATPRSAANRASNLRTRQQPEKRAPALKVPVEEEEPAIVGGTFSPTPPHQQAARKAPAAQPGPSKPRPEAKLPETGDTFSPTPPHQQPARKDEPQPGPSKSRPEIRQAAQAEPAPARAAVKLRPESRLPEKGATFSPTPPRQHQLQKTPAPLPEPTKLRAESRTKSRRSAEHEVVPDTAPEPEVEAMPEAPAPAPVDPSAAKKFFAWSTFSDQNALEAQVEIVKQLGGNSNYAPDAENSGLLPTTTHLIAERMLRNEKVLSAIASGCFILTPRYLEACAKHGRFIREEAYEWASELADAADTDVAKVVSKTALFWRQKLEGKRKAGEKKIGAFSDWRLIIYAESNPDVYRRIVRYGGGIAELRSDLSDVRLFKPTHVIIHRERNMAPWDKNELARVVRAGAKIFPPDYLFTFLSKRGIYDITDCTDSYRKFIGNRSSELPDRW